MASTRNQNTVVRGTRGKATRTDYVKPTRKAPSSRPSTRDQNTAAMKRRKADIEKSKSTPKPSSWNGEALGRRTQPGDLGPGGIDYTSVSGLPPAPPVGPEGPDPLKALFDALAAQLHTDVGPGPNLNDYIGGFGPARQNALGYQGAATSKINSGTQGLVQALQQIQAGGQQNYADSTAAARAATSQVGADQAAAAAKAAADLQAQGVSAAPVEAAQQQVSGALATQGANQDALTARMAQLQQQQSADRQASAQTIGQGAVGQLGLNTNAALNDINLQEAQARRQYGQDASQHAAAASNAASHDVERRLQLAQQFADLDNSTQVDPTEQVRRAYHGVGEVEDAFDQLDSGQVSPANLRIQIRTAIAKEKSNPREAQNHDKLSRLAEVEKAIGEWEKATHPDNKKAAKEKQTATLAKYLQPH